MSRPPLTTTKVCNLDHVAPLLSSVLRPVSATVPSANVVAVAVQTALQEGFGVSLQEIGAGELESVIANAPAVTMIAAACLHLSADPRATGNDSIASAPYTAAMSDWTRDVLDHLRAEVERRSRRCAQPSSIASCGGLTEPVLGRHRVASPLIPSPQAPFQAPAPTQQSGQLSQGAPSVPAATQAAAYRQPVTQESTQGSKPMTIAVVQWGCPASGTNYAHQLMAILRAELPADILRSVDILTPDTGPPAAPSTTAPIVLVIRVSSGKGDPVKEDEKHSGRIIGVSIADGPSRDTAPLVCNWDAQRDAIRAGGHHTGRTVTAIQDKVRELLKSSSAPPQHGWTPQPVRTHTYQATNSSSNNYYHTSGSSYPPSTTAYQTSGSSYGQQGTTISVVEYGAGQQAMVAAIRTLLHNAVQADPSTRSSVTVDAPQIEPPAPLGPHRLVVRVVTRAAGRAVANFPPAERVVYVEVADQPQDAATMVINYDMSTGGIKAGGHHTQATVSAIKQLATAQQLQPDMRNATKTSSRWGWW